jgi:hypothetical protein
MRRARGHQPWARSSSPSRCIEQLHRVRRPKYNEHADHGCCHVRQWTLAPLVVARMDRRSYDQDPWLNRDAQQTLSRVASPSRFQPCYIRFVSFRTGSLRCLVRAVALTLLAWTALDLTNIHLCALDAASSERTIVVDGRAPGGAITANTPDPGSPRSGADDCFCCSHCVDVCQTLMRPAPMMLAQAAQELHEFLPPASGHGLFHPPQLS